MGKYWVDNETTEGVLPPDAPDPFALCVDHPAKKTLAQRFVSWIGGLFNMQCEETRDVTVFLRDGNERSFLLANHTRVDQDLLGILDCKWEWHYFPLDLVAEFTIKVNEE